MAYKTTEAHRRASQKYRKENREVERVKTYRRTAKMYLNKHATLEECMELHALSLSDFEQKLTDIPEKYQKNYLLLMKDQLRQQLGDITRMEEEL